MRLFNGAIAFVTMVRLLLAGVAFMFSSLYSATLGSVPGIGGAGRSKRLCSIFSGVVDAHSPSWMERHGRFTFLLKTSAGSDRLNTLSDSIPEWFMSAWLRFAVGTMVVFLVAWGVILLVALAFLGKVSIDLSKRAVGWVMAYDWMSIFGDTGQQEYNPLEAFLALIESAPEILDALATLGVFLVLMVALYWVIIIFLLPGLTLHEFGHYAATRYVGASVESYGLLLIGPLPGGAFVDPSDETEDLSVAEGFALYSAGIANSLVWGVCLLLVGAYMIEDPLAMLEAWWLGDHTFFWDHTVESVLLLLGVVEVGNSFFNSIPIGKLDGGLFIQTAEEGWWGLDDSYGFDQRVHRVLELVGVVG